MWYDHGGMSGAGWLGMSVTMVIFWGLVIWGIVALVRYVNAPGTREPSADQRDATPETLLAQRFARSEIDEAEYARKRETLRSTDSTADGGGIEKMSHERDSEAVTR